MLIEDIEVKLEEFDAKMRKHVVARIPPGRYRTQTEIIIGRKAFEYMKIKYEVQVREWVGYNDIGSKVERNSDVRVVVRPVKESRWAWKILINEDRRYFDHGQYLVSISCPRNFRAVLLAIPQAKAAIETYLNEVYPKLTWNLEMVTRRQERDRVRVEGIKKFIEEYAAPLALIEAIK